MTIRFVERIAIILLVLAVIQFFFIAIEHDDSSRTDSLEDSETGLLKILHYAIGESEDKEAL